MHPSGQRDFPCHPIPIAFAFAFVFAFLIAISRCASGAVGSMKSCTQLSAPFAPDKHDFSHILQGVPHS
jgi:hypothetical protein